LLDTARAAELSLDERLLDEVGDEESRQLKASQQKKAIAKAKAELNQLLEQPVPGVEKVSQPKSSTGKDLGLGSKNNYRGGSNDGLRRKGGMIVFAK
jgi:hypothetical protein